MIAQASNAETSGTGNKGLIRAGGVAAWIVAALTLGEVVLLAIYPQPGTVIEWFQLFQRNKLIGLVDFWGLEIPMYFMFILIFLALYLVFRETHGGIVGLALILVLVGTGIFLATNNPFSMLTLSNQYAAADPGTERSMLLAAGQTILANTNQRAVGGFNMGLFLVSIAGLVVSLVMLRSSLFGRWAAWAGILANGVSLADYLREALTSSVVITLLVIFVDVLFLLLWYILLGRKLYHLGRHPKKALPEQS